MPSIQRQKSSPDLLTGIDPLKSSPPTPELKRAKSMTSVVSPELIKEDIETKKTEHKDLRELTDPETLETQTQEMDLETIIEKVHTPELEQLLESSGLGDELGHLTTLQQTKSDLEGTGKLLEGEVTTDTLSSTVGLVSRLSDMSGDKSLSGHLSKVDEVLSKEDDVNNTIDLLKGEVTTENMKSTVSVLDTTAKVLGSGSMRKVTKSLLPPVSMVHSGKETWEDLKEMYDEPSMENLKELAKSGLQFGKDLSDTVDMLPGGSVVTKLAKTVGGKMGGRMVPILNMILAMEDTYEAFDEIKDIFEDPSFKNISEAFFSTLGAAGSIATATNIPIVSQIGMGVVFVTDMIELAMDTGFQEGVKKVKDKVVSGVKSMVNDVTSFFGFGDWLTT